MFGALTATCIIWLLCAVFLKRIIRPSSLPRPPGPKPWPLLGNALDLPRLRPWERFHQWCQDSTSDIIYLSALGRDFVVLDSLKAAGDLLEKKSQIYSDRVPSPLIELIGGTFNFIVMPYAPFWRAHRRMFHQHFQASVVHQYHLVQLQHVRSCLSQILSSSQHLSRHIRLMSTSSIFSVIYGKKISGVNDEYVQWAEKSLQAASKILVPGAYPVEALPFLRHMPRWFPGTNYYDLVDQYKSPILKVRDVPYAEAASAFDRGAAPPSFVASVLGEIRDKHGRDTAEESEQRLIARNVSATVYSAAVDTTSSYASSFLLAMALYPNVQKKAQAEVDNVIGCTRLPEFEDLEHLVYVRAVIKETLRWMPVLPFGVPHALTEDDVYKGYHLPKGAAVIPNIWAMMHDPEVYPGPYEFRPERFIGTDGQLDLSVPDPADVVFGFGRRACPGKPFSLNTLSMFVASVLSVLDIDAGVDEAGRPVQLNTEPTDKLIVFPATIPRGYTPRSKAAEQLLSGY